MSEALRRSRDVRAVLSRGHVVHGTHVVVRVRCRGDGARARWTVSASRRVGSAVRRNRAKRRLRAVVRELELPSGSDVVVIARRSSVDCGFEALRTDIAELVRRADDGETVEVRR